MNAFKAYDIRGVYNKDFNKDDVYKAGYFIPKLLNADRVLVGRDARETSEEIFEALSKGINDAGADVYNMGFTTTPMVYFFTARHSFDASVQITASHNPKEYNGLKISKTAALPVGWDSGLKELKKLMETDEIRPAFPRGIVKDYQVEEGYVDFMRAAAPDISDLEVAVDCSNGMAALLIGKILGDRPHYLYDTLDGSFPNHDPNPLIEKNVRDLKNLVLEKGCDIGVIFDGDADRVMFVDERGNFISPDLIIGVLAQYYLREEKGPVLHDIRTSRSVTEYIQKLGGTPHMGKVGHAFAKVKMREIGAIFGGELAGHYYFREFYNCDSGILASLSVLRIAAELKREGRGIADLIDEIAKYAFSGEINFHIEEKQDAMDALKKKFTTAEEPTAVYDIDGYRIEFPEWWFNVRPSNTEPYLRLVVEAANESLLEEKLEQLQKVLKPFGERES